MKKKEVALGHAFEHHLLARPSLDLVMYKQKMIACEQLKNQLQAETSTNTFYFLHMCWIFSENDQANFGRKQANLQAFCFVWPKQNISASSRQKLRNKIDNFNCSRPLSRDNGGMDKNPTLWCRSGCCSDSPYVLQSNECARLEIQKCSCVPASDIWSSCT